MGEKYPLTPNVVDMLKIQKVPAGNPEYRQIACAIPISSSTIKIRYNNIIPFLIIQKWMNLSLIEELLFIIPLYYPTVNEIKENLRILFLPKYVQKRKRTSRILLDLFFFIMPLNEIFLVRTDKNQNTGSNAV